MTFPIVTEAAYLTLHYRLAALEGADMVSTFHDHPATLQLGTGQLAPFLEACLMGLPEGAHRVFELQPEQAFGVHNAALVQKVSWRLLENNPSLSAAYAVGDVVEFSAPTRGRFSGILRSIEDDAAVLDFNHPLAGQAIQFEVQIIGIL